MSRSAPSREIHAWQQPILASSVSRSAGSVGTTSLRKARDDAADFVDLCMISDSWHIDLANTAWGAIVAALVAATVGVLFKGMADSRLAKAQGEITKQVQQYL